MNIPASDTEYVYGIDHVIDETSSVQQVNIKLLSGDFAGTIVHYNHVSIDESEGETKLQFTYKIVKPSEGHTVNSLEQNMNFKQRLGDTLLHIIREMIDNINKEQEKNVTGTSDIEGTDKR